jgi:hypothetical protein
MAIGFWYLIYAVESSACFMPRLFGGGEKIKKKFLVGSCNTNMS